MRNIKPIKLVPRTNDNAALNALTDDQLARIGELAIQR